MNLPFGRNATLTDTLALCGRTQGTLEQLDNQIAITSKRGPKTENMFTGDVFGLSATLDHTNKISITRTAILENKSGLFDILAFR